MIKKLHIFLLILLSLTIVGCSQEKTEEERKAELRAEIEAENALRAEVEAEVKAEMEAKEKATEEANEKVEVQVSEKYGNVEDKETVYEFLSSVNINIEKEEFIDYYRENFIDINSDGNMDVVYNSKEWYGELLFLLSESGGYKVLDLDYGKTSENHMEKIYSIKCDNEFIIVEGENIGNAYGDKRTDIFYFDGNKVKGLNSFKTHLMNGARTYFSGEGYIRQMDGYNKINYQYEQVEVDENENEKEQIRIDIIYELDLDKLEYVGSENGVNYNYLENPNEEKDHKESQSFDVFDLKVGDNIDDFVISEIDVNKDDTVSINFKGEKTIEGEIYFEEMDHTYGFSQREPMLYRPITYSTDLYPDMELYDGPFFKVFTREELEKLIDESHLKKIDEGEMLIVKVRIKNPSFSLKFESGMGTNFELINLEIIE